MKEKPYGIHVSCSYFRVIVTAIYRSVIDQNDCMRVTDSLKYCSLINRKWTIFVGSELLYERLHR